MNKVIIKEMKSRHIIITIVLYAIYVILGFALLGLCKERVYELTDYSYAFFYSLAFVTLIAYFINRRPIDYELLFLGFINVCVGTFSLSIKAVPEAGIVIADAVLMYAILNIANKLYSCKLLIEQRDISFFPKMAVTILLFFIGLLVVSLLRNEIEAGIIIMGYYYAIFGLLSLLEPLTKIVCGNATLKSIVFDFLSYKKEQNKKEDQDKPLKVKEIQNSKPVVKKRVTKKEPAKKTKKVNKTKKTK